MELKELQKNVDASASASATAAPKKRGRPPANGGIMNLLNIEK